MPAPLAVIDWTGLRTNSMSMGIRGAARAASADMSAEDQERFVQRVMKRASREGWEEERVRILSAASTPRPQQPQRTLSAPVRNGADTAALALASHSERSRTALAKAVTKASEHVAKQPAEAILKSAKPLRDVAAIGDTVHGWRQQVVQVGVQVSVGSMGVD